MKAPKISIQIGADTGKLKRDMKNADSIVSKFTKAAVYGLGAATAAAGAFAFKLGKDGVEAAIEDAASQRTLAKTLQNTTKATDAQIASVEEYITATSLAFGITDDKLRPALARLVRSTKNASEAQKLLNLALDVSSATGKNIETVTAALGKAYDGNAASLGRLGLGLDASILKSKNFDVIFKALRKSFDGFAAQEADTTEGKLRRLQIAFDETTESVGYALLPELEKLSTWATSPEGAAQIAQSVNTITTSVQTLAGVLSEVGGLFQRLQDFGDMITPDMEQIKANLTEPVMYDPRHPGYGSLRPKVNSPSASSGYNTTSGPPVQITVNGAIDPVSTARQIQKLLNQATRLNVSPRIGERGN